MLKKLVKYGNSNALILDRAILELLNISEGAVVKLHTDGKSLIITPQEAAEVKDLWMEGMEKPDVLKNSRATQAKQQADQLKITDPAKLQPMQELMPGAEKNAKLASQINAIMEKYKKDLALLTTEPFLHEIDSLAAKYCNDKTLPAFEKEYHALRLQYAPNLANFDKEMQVVQAQAIEENPVKYEKMKLWARGTENYENLDAAVKVIMEKYKGDIALVQSEAFLYEVDVLIKKHKGDQSSLEFTKDFMALYFQYAPNLKNMEKEMQEAQKALGMPDSFE